MAKAARKPSTAGAKGGAARVSPASTPSDRAIAMKEEADAARHAAKLAIEDARRVLIDAAANDTAKTINRDESTAGQTWLKLGEAFHKALFDERTGKDRVPMNQQPRIYLTDDGKGPPVKGLEAIAEIHPSIRSKARRMYLLDAEESQVPGEAYRVNEQGEREPLNRVPPGLRHPGIDIRVGYPTHTIAKYNDALKRYKHEVGWDSDEDGEEKAPVVLDGNAEAKLRVRYLIDPDGGRGRFDPAVRDSVLLKLAEAMEGARLGRLMHKAIDDAYMVARTSPDAKERLSEKEAKKALVDVRRDMDGYVERERRRLEALARARATEEAAAREGQPKGKTAGEPKDEPEGEARGGGSSVVAPRMDVLEGKLVGVGEPGPEEDGNTYELLGVSLKATQPTVNKRYKRLLEVANEVERDALVNAYHAICSERGWTPNAED